MSSPANPSSRARADLTVYIAFFLALLVTTNSPAAAVDPKRCELAKTEATTRKTACDQSWGVCFYLDEKGNEVSKGCTSNDLRALAINCRDASVAAEHRKAACGR